MSNRIRQGSILSPYLFNVYVDDLNHILNKARIGCHIADKPTNNFSYADDLVILAPCAATLNELSTKCGNFLTDNYIIFSTSKSVSMCILPKSSKLSKFQCI